MRQPTNRSDRVRFAAAAARQTNERLLATAKPVPARITMALDMRNLDGPDVDTACGAVEPAVDLWECGVEVPTPEQLVLLAKLTDFPVGYFFRPIEPGPLFEGVIMCSDRPRRCVSVETDYVDERGVLHYGGQPPRTPPAGAQGSLW